MIAFTSKQFVYEPSRLTYKALGWKLGVNLEDIADGFTIDGNVFVPLKTQSDSQVFVEEARGVYRAIIVGNNRTGLGAGKNVKTKGYRSGHRSSVRR